MDFIIDLPPSVGDGTIYDSILVVVNRYTKVARYVLCTKTLTTNALVELFLNTIVRLYRVLKGIVSN
jgi:hypothetical protein